MLKSTILTLFLLSIISCKNETPNKDVIIKDSETLVKAIHNRHHENASKYITFDQNTIFYDSLGKVSKKEYWYEAISRPGKLHFRYVNFESGNGFMYNDGHMYFFKENKVEKEIEEKFNVWTVLCHDAYTQDPDITINILKSKKKINFDLFYETTWENRQVYVVGAEEGDYKSVQFWVDKEHLYLVRDIFLKENGSIGDVRYVNYKKHGEEWIEGGLIVFYDKKLFLEEFYENIRTHKSLNDDLFNPENFSKTTSFF